MHCLVLGAGGFIGTHLTSKLLTTGHLVIAYDNEQSVSKLAVNSMLKCEPGDFTTETRWHELLKGVKVCYHLISTTTPKSSNDDPMADVSGNLISTLKLLEAARQHNVKIIYISSGGTVYGKVSESLIGETHFTDPLCSYGVTKLAIEKYLRLYYELYGIESVILRLANPYGQGQSPESNQGAIAVFIGKILLGHTINIWGNGSVIRDYIYIKDVIAAMITAASYGGRSRVFNIGSGVGTSLIDIIKSIEDVTQKTADVIFHPPRGFDVPINVLDVTKAKMELKWRNQTTLSDGITQTVRWVQAQYDHFN